MSIYHLIFLGEPPITDPVTENLSKTFKGTEQECRKEFHKWMLEAFSSFDYTPEDILEQDIKITKDYGYKIYHSPNISIVRVEYDSSLRTREKKTADSIKDNIRPDERKKKQFLNDNMVQTRHKIINFGVSGGLHLDFEGLLYPAQPKIIRMSY